VCVDLRCSVQVGGASVGCCPGAYGLRDAYIYIHICIYIHTFIHIFIYVCVCVCLCIYILARPSKEKIPPPLQVGGASVWRGPCAYGLRDAYIYMYVCVCVFMCVCYTYTLA